MDTVSLFRFFASFVLVLSLLGLLFWALRRYGGRLGLPMVMHQSQRRLRVLEVLPLDARRKLVLFSRDNKEHLIMLGINDSLVVESDVQKTLQSQNVPSAPPKRSAAKKGKK